MSCLVFLCPALPCPALPSTALPSPALSGLNLQYFCLTRSHTLSPPTVFYDGFCPAYKWPSLLIKQRRYYLSQKGLNLASTSGIHLSSSNQSLLSIFVDSFFNCWSIVVTTGVTKSISPRDFASQKMLYKLSLPDLFRSYVAQKVLLTCVSFGNYWNFWWLRKGKHWLLGNYLNAEQCYWLNRGIEDSKEK